VISCIENNVALFSPHTCWDAVQNGINDWLIRPYGMIWKGDTLSE